MRGFGLALALVWSATATAQTADDPPWYAGLPVADVRLSSPDGGLPEESLEPLLRVVEGAPLALSAMRLDLVTLYRVGEFSAVEADIEPWVVTDAEGALVPGVLLTYIVHPAPIAASVRVTGHDWVRALDIERAARIDLGESFYEELDAPPVEERIRALLEARGFPEGHAVVGAQPLPGTHQVDVLIHVEEGPPVLVDRLELAGRFPVPERRIRRWIGRAGVKEGKPLAASAVTDAQVAVRTRLASLGGGFTPSRGYVSARVTPAITGDGEGGTQVTYTIEPGPRLELKVRGLSWRPRAKAREAIGIDERARLTRGFLEAAPERMDTWLMERGFYTTHTDVRLDEDPRGRWQVLHVDIERGPRYLVHRVAFDGNTQTNDAELRTVMDQASDTVLRLGRATEPALLSGVRSIEDLYRSRGYLDVRARLAEIRVAEGLHDLEPDGRPPLWRVLSRPLRPGTRYLIPRVEVSEGPLTHLVALEVKGAAPDVDLAAIEVQREALVDGPYSPQALAALAREVVLAHRRAGYLEADARVNRAPAGEQALAAEIEVEPGILVRMRSLVFRGTRLTRQSTIRREVPLVLGEPITSTALEDMRRSLYDLDVFRTVSPELIGDGAARDLVVRLDERPLWAFELGGGVATDQGIRGFGRVTRRNLWGLAHRLDLYALAGFDWIGNSVTDWRPDFLAPEWRAAVSYTAPRFPWKSSTAVIDLLLRERMQERYWQMSRSGAGIAIDTAFTPKMSLRTGIRVESRRLIRVDTGALLPGEVWTELVDPKYPELPSPDRWQGSVYALWLVDLRDSPMAPTRGVFLSVLGEWAPTFKTLQNTVTASWLKSDVRVSGYIPIGGPILNLSAEATYGASLDGGILPLEDRYRLGGTGSLRGFRRDSVGPTNQVAQYTMDWPEALGPAIGYATRENDTRWVATGGDTRVLAVAELLLPLPVLGLRAWDGYALALFGDVGNVWLLNTSARGVATSDQEPYRTLHHPAVRYGLGVGLRVGTPVGPLQIDLAANPAALAARGEVKQLLREQWAEPTVRFHLSLGSL